MSRFYGTQHFGVPVMTRAVVPAARVLAPAMHPAVAAAITAVKAPPASVHVVPSMPMNLHPAITAAVQAVNPPPPAPPTMMTRVSPAMVPSASATTAPSLLRPRTLVPSQMMPRGLPVRSVVPTTPLFHPSVRAAINAVAPKTPQLHPHRTMVFAPHIVWPTQQTASQQRYLPSSQAQASSPQLIPSPVGSVISSAPAGFAPYMIRPEYKGAPVRAQVVPAYWNDQTQNSFNSPTPPQAVDMQRTTVTQGGQLLSPSTVGPEATRVQQIFRTALAQKVSQAAVSQQAAVAAQSQAVQAAHVANTLATHANNAIAAAATNPVPHVLRAQDTAVAQANSAADIATQSGLTAQLHAQQAQADTESANEALASSGHTVTARGAIVPISSLTNTQQLISSTANPAASGSTSVPVAAITNDSPISYAPAASAAAPAVDDSGSDPTAAASAPMTSTMSTIGATAMPVASSSGPLALAAGAVGVGFLLGGPIGALVGLLGGGAYAYKKSNDANAQAQAISQSIAAQTAAAANAAANAAPLPSGGAAAMSSLRGFLGQRW